MLCYLIIGDSCQNNMHREQPKFEDNSDFTVYTQVLQCRDENINYFYCGYSESEFCGYASSQSNAINKIKEHYPKGATDVLELNRAVLLLTDIKGDGEISYPKSSSNIEFTHQIKQYLNDKEEEYDVVTCHEMASYISAIDLFPKVFEVLRNDGTLIVVGEFSLEPASDAGTTQHSLAIFIRQAERFGFILNKQENWSKNVMPSLNHLQELLDEKGERVDTKSNISQQLIDHALSLTKSRIEQLNNTTIYALLSFSKVKRPRWQLRYMDNYSRDLAFNLFRICFHHEMDEALWEWKYQGEVQVKSINAWRGTELVGHYGGMSRSVMMFGKRVNAVQIGDVMVHPTERSAFTKKGVFYQMATTFIEMNIGYERHYILSYGFPNERQMKLGKSLGLYDEVERVVKAEWKSIKSKAQFKIKVRQFNESCKQHQQAVNTLWTKMASDLGDSIVGVRDWEYLSRRYLKHPTRQYSIFIVSNRVGGKARGIIVLQKEEDSWALMDVIGAVLDIPILVKQARRVVGGYGGEILGCWISSGFSSYFDKQAVWKDINIPIAHNTWTLGPQTTQVYQKWWLMSGDTDFL